MIYDKAFFDQPLQRQGTRSVKWDAAAKAGADALPMWVADWDFRCAEPIVQALKDRAAHPCYGYTHDDANDAGAFCGFWLRRHQLHIDPEQTFMLPCVITGLRLAVRCFAEKGEGVIYMPPVYAPFCASIEMNGRKPLAAPLLADSQGRYSMDFDAIENHLRNGAKCILFCNPHNPVSRAWAKEELQRLVDLANSYHAVLISDEIHADFVYKPHVFVPMLSLKDAGRCTVVCASASKTFNVPGIQQATMVSFNPELLGRIRTEAECAGVTSGNTFALVATQQAYSACDAWLDGLLAYLEESCEILRTEIARLLPRAVLTPIEATSLCWLDLRAYAPTCEELDARLRAHGLILNRGEMFDAALGQGFMRLNFGCPHETLREGLNRLAAAMNE